VKRTEKTYKLHALDSPEGEIVLARQGVTRADVEHAVAELERTDGIRIRTIIGINDDGVFGSTRDGWTWDLPDAFSEPMIARPWQRIFELLGRVPEGESDPPTDEGGPDN